MAPTHPVLLGLQTVGDSKPELLRSIEVELDAMRGRAEAAKTLAYMSHSESKKDSLREHAATIERAVTSLEAIVRDLRKSWE
jgi:hypothetical protein